MQARIAEDAAGVEKSLGIECVYLIVLELAGLLSFLMDCLSQVGEVIFLVNSNVSPKPKKLNGTIRSANVSALL